MNLRMETLFKSAKLPSSSSFYCNIIPCRSKFIRPYRCTDTNGSRYDLLRTNQKLYFSGPHAVYSQSIVVLLPKSCVKFAQCSVEMSVCESVVINASKHNGTISFVCFSLVDCGLICSRGRRTLFISSYLFTHTLVSKRFNLLACQPYSVCTIFLSQISRTWSTRRGLIRKIVLIFYFLLSNSSIHMTSQIMNKVTGTWISLYEILYRLPLPNYSKRFKTGNFESGNREFAYGLKGFPVFRFSQRMFLVFSNLSGTQRSGECNI